MKLRMALVLFAAFSLTIAGCGKKDAAGGAKKAASSKKKDGKKKKKSSYAEGDVANGGSISGTVTYTGDKKDGAVTITKDKEVCKDQPQERALVVTDGKVKNAVVVLQGIKAGKKFADNPLVVDNVACRFEPRISVGRLGGKITTKNSDTVLHNTHLYLKKGGKTKNLFNIALPNKGQSIEKPLKKPGIIDIKCDAHEWMQAFVFVAEHPYVAVTGADGSFSMSDVPAGVYSAKIWHEKLGEKEVKVTVSAGGAATADVAFN